MQRRVFGRYLKVIFYNDKISESIDSDNAYFTVKNEKYLSHMKDETSIVIYNIDKHTLNSMLNKKFDRVKVYCGYKGGAIKQENLILVARILSITTDYSDLKTSKTHVICSSKYHKRDANAIKFNAGQSLYSILNYICKRSKINAFIDESLKNNFLQKDFTVQHINNALAQIIKDYNFIEISNESEGQNFDIVIKKMYNQKAKLIKISPENGTLIKSHITMDKDGTINFTSLPITEFTIGSYINVDLNNINKFVSDTNAFKTNRIIENKIEKIKNSEESSRYIITYLNYDLDPRGSFEVQIKAKPTTFFKRNIKRSNF